MENDSPAIWSEDGLRSKIFDDVYYTPRSGLEESRHVFLKGNGLPEAWLGKKEFRIGELGFGSGLNWLAVRSLVRNQTGNDAPKIVFSSVERYPLSRDQMARTAALWPELKDGVDELLSFYFPKEGDNRWSFEGGEVRLWIGDVTELERTMSRIDAWFFDGFSPAKNPHMWSLDVFQRAARVSVPQATFATFTSAGVVKRALREAGFFVRRQPGFAQKRHMTVGYYQGSLSKV